MNVNGRMSGYDILGQDKFSPLVSARLPQSNYEMPTTIHDRIQIVFPAQDMSRYFLVFPPSQRDSRSSPNLARREQADLAA
jgi:hypothetical protein